jgi:hypothetical protein
MSLLNRTFVRIDSKTLFLSAGEQLSPMIVQFFIPFQKLYSNRRRMSQKHIPSKTLNAGRRRHQKVFVETDHTDHNIRSFDAAED